MTYAGLSMTVARSRGIAVLATAFVCSSWLLAAAAKAEEGGPDREVVSGPTAEKTQAAATTGAFLPFSQVASFENQRAWATGLTGYDSARHTGTFEAATEVRLWGPISVRGGAVYTNGNQTLRPSFGARVQALREDRHGVAGAIGVFYRPEGLTEPEGEIETVVSVGRHVGRTYLLANLLYGQDPEGNERDGEIRVAALHPIASRFVIGGDGRLRFDLGSNAAKLAQHHEPTMDLAVGPCASALLGPVALSLQGGASALRFEGIASYGAFALVGIGVAL